MEEAIKLRSHVNHDEASLHQLVEALSLLADHFKSEVYSG